MLSIMTPSNNMGCYGRSGQNATNNKFKSDSQRLALSLQASLVFMAQWFS